MSNDAPVSYRGCEIFIGPDHRGRKQLWVSIPGHSGTERFACNTIEDGKAAVDAHFDYQEKANNRWTAIGVLLAGALAILILFGLGAS